MSMHAVVWIDHKEAHVFHVSLGDSDETTIVSPRQIHHYPRGHADATRHPEAAKHYFDAVVKLVGGADEVLILGPSTAKLEFVRHVGDHDHAFAAKIVGVENTDHPTDGQLVAYARRYFKRTGRMQAI